MDKKVVGLLVDVARCAEQAMDDTVDDGNGLHWNTEDFTRLGSVMELLDDLPDDKPGYTLSAAGKAEWAIEKLDDKPIDMVLHCPKCGLQHIDCEEWADDPHDIEHGQMRTWANPPHRSHLCFGCNHIWRPADVPTNGVAAIKTRGKNDSQPVSSSRLDSNDSYMAWLKDNQKYIEPKDCLAWIETAYVHAHKVSKEGK